MIVWKTYFRGHDTYWELWTWSVILRLVCLRDQVKVKNWHLPVSNIFPHPKCRTRSHRLLDKRTDSQIFHHDPFSAFVAHRVFLFYCVFRECMCRCGQRGTVSGALTRIVTGGLGFWQQRVNNLHRCTESDAPLSSGEAGGFTRLLTQHQAEPEKFTREWNGPTKDGWQCLFLTLLVHEGSMLSTRNSEPIMEHSYFHWNR